MPRSKIRNSTFTIDVGGTNGGIIIPNSPSLNPTDYIAVTMRVFLKEGVPCDLIDNSSNGVTNHIYCYVDGAGLLYWYSTIGGISRNIIGAKAVYKPNDFNVYTFLYDGTKVEILANGELVYTLFCTGALGVNAGSFRIGQYWTGAVNSQALFSKLVIYHTNAYKFQNHLDFLYQDYTDPAIYATRVLDIDSSTGSGTTVFDLSPAGNNGAFSRGIWSTIVPYKARTAVSSRVPVSGRTPISGRVKINMVADGTIIPRILNLQGWYKGSDLAALADGGLVSTWPDASGLANDVTASGGLRPTLYKTTTAQLLNGYPTVFFNGTNSLKKNSGFTGQPWTIFLVLRLNIEPSNQTYFDGATVLTANMFRLSFNHRIYAGASIGSIPASGTPWRILTGVFNGAQSVCALDSIEVQGNAGLNTSSGVTIGAAGDNTSGINGNIAEVIVAVGNVNESCRRQVRQYLCAKYNL